MDLLLPLHSHIKRTYAMSADQSTSLYIAWITNSQYNDTLFMELFLSNETNNFKTHKNQNLSPPEINQFKRNQEGIPHQQPISKGLLNF
jgi:hypothetical protein